MLLKHSSANCQLWEMLYSLMVKIWGYLFLLFWFNSFVNILVAFCICVCACGSFVVCCKIKIPRPLKMVERSPCFMTWQWSQVKTGRKEKILEVSFIVMLVMGMNSILHLGAHLKILSTTWSRVWTTSTGGGHDKHPQKDRSRGRVMGEMARER